MRQFLFFAILLFCNHWLYSQLPFGFVPIDYQVLTIENPQSLTLMDDQVSMGVPIGFSFSFFEVPYTQLGVSSNGYVTFRSQAFNSTSPYPNQNTTINTLGFPLNSIFLAWMDLNPAILQSQGIRYGTNGTAPNRVFIVEYDAVVNFGCGNNASFSGQLHLYEGTDVIELHITDKMICDTSTGWINFAYQGIVNANGTQFYTVAGHDNSVPWTATNEAWQFGPFNLDSLRTSFITGRVIADLNGNCILDEGEYLIENQTIVFNSEERFAITNSIQGFSFNVFPWTYNGLTYNPGVISSSVVCPELGFYQDIIVDTAIVVDAFDFYVYPDTLCVDLQCALHQIGEFQSCFGDTVLQHLVVRNTGFLPIESYSVSIETPDSVSLIGSNPPYTMNDGNTYTWVFEDTLYFGGINTIVLYELIECGVSELSSKCFFSSVNTPLDCNVLNNLDTLCLFVNEPVQLNAMQVKSPLDLNFVSETIVIGDERYYDFKFEYNHTGNNPLNWLKLKFTLPTSFDPDYIDILSSTNSFGLIWQGNGIWQMESFDFNEFDSSMVYSGTRGSIVFRVRTLMDLIPFQVAGIRAYVTFNMESPFYTNVAYIRRPGPSDIKTLENYLEIYPNPANDILTIVDSGRQINSIRIFDVTGGLMKSIDSQLVNHSIVIRDLKSGIYFIELYSNSTRISVKKFLVLR